jgi:hypothetical protein
MTTARITEKKPEFEEGAFDTASLLLKLQAALSEGKAFTRMFSPKNIKLEPLFYARSPEKIRYAKSPDSKPEEIARDKFAKMNGFTWTDAMFGSASMRDSVVSDEKYKKLAIPLLKNAAIIPLKRWLFVRSH